MILRRVIEHVRNQQWTAIGIDLVIVVVGVAASHDAAVSMRDTEPDSRYYEVFNIEVPA